MIPAMINFMIIVTSYFIMHHIGVSLFKDVLARGSMFEFELGV